MDSIVADRRYFHGMKEVIPFVYGMLTEQDKETAIALIKTATTKLDQEVKTDDDGILFNLLECIEECSEDQGKLLTEMADVFGSFLNFFSSFSGFSSSVA